MNQRLLSSFVGLLYVSMALTFGLLHDHHHEHATATGHDDDCAACQWELQAITDPPVCVVVPIIVQDVVIRSLLIPVSVPSESPFLPATASRAPPVTPT